MQKAKNLKEYNRELGEALDNDFLRKAMDKFAVDYRAARANAFKDQEEEALIRQVVRVKDAGIDNMLALYEEFQTRAQAAGVHVHLAKTALEANEIIADIARSNKCKKIIKSKSMTAEETLLNHHLEPEFEVTETDLGEWIIQLRHEGPTHMVMPAIHLSRYQVADLFTDVTTHKQDPDIQRLVKVARRELRAKYIEADMGISGANFAIAKTGTLGIVTNEGNARLVTTLPRVHVALVGLDKLCASLKDALTILRVLPRNATGQAITSYVTWITGANECLAAETKDGKKEMHIVFLDNGRRQLAKDPLFKQVLRCVRCGACANVCPVYRMVGGHQMGHVYIGAIGLILTYFFHGRDKAKNLVQNCINCEACKHVCAAGIDLPRLIKEIHARIQDEEGHPLTSVLLGKVLKNRKLFHTLLRTAKAAQRPVTGGTKYLRHLPQLFAKDQDFRALPAIAKKPFRDMWQDVRPRKPAHPRFRVALFSGCVQDFVYPEQLVDGIKVLADHGVDLDFPMGQSCCGLPVQMMGEKQAAKDVAIQNVTAIDPADYDYILTLCASCASHLKNNYPFLVGDEPIVGVKVQQFADKVITFSTFVNDVLHVTKEEFNPSGRKTTFHSPCHLCRGMGVVDAPHELIEKSGYDFVQADEEQVCCGFGGTYTSKFAKVSEQILKNKLDDVEKTGADLLVTECPGCVLQLRGGMDTRGGRVEVLHIAEALARAKK
jgi:iron-sulfur cluster protein